MKGTEKRCKEHGALDCRTILAYCGRSFNEDTFIREAKQGISLSGSLTQGSYIFTLTDEMVDRLYFTVVEGRSALALACKG